MARLTKRLLLERLCKSFKEGGWNIELISEDVHPIQLRLQRGRVRVDLRAYVWNLTHGGKPRSKDEMRIQATGVEKFEKVVGEPTLILGWSQELEVFAGFDVDRHDGQLGSSPSLQIAKSTLQAANEKGIAARKKGNSEIVVAMKPALLGDYVENLRDLHSLSEAQATVEALRHAVDIDGLSRLSQLSGYIERIEDGVTPTFGTIGDLEGRKAILERISVLEREIEEIRKQPGMIGHNRPPPDEELSDPSVSDIAKAAQKIGEELQKDSPRPAEVARNATILERAAALWRALKREAAKTGEQLKNEIRKRAAETVVSFGVAGATVFHKQLGELVGHAVDAILTWLHLVVS